MVYDPFIVLLALFAIILLKIFASVFISDIGLQFSFFVACLSGFGNRVMVASQNELWSLSSSAIFWKSLSKIGVSSCLNFWQNSPVKPSCPGLFFVGRFFYYSFNLCACDHLLIFSIPPWFSFGRLSFSKNLSISSKLSILLAYNCSQQSLMILCISVLSVVISSFSFLILLILFFFHFFLMSLQIIKIIQQRASKADSIKEGKELENQQMCHIIGVTQHKSKKKKILKRLKKCYGNYGIQQKGTIC